MGVCACVCVCVCVCAHAESALAATKLDLVLENNEIFEGKRRIPPHPHQETEHWYSSQNLEALILVLGSVSFTNNILNIITLG